jgi:hypothetical protein
METDGNGNPRRFVVRRRVQLTGDLIEDAQATFQDGYPVVSFRFNDAGAIELERFTRDNEGRQFAIVMDGKVITAPIIRNPIPGGVGLISGNFTVQGATDLALYLRAGALPVSLIIIEGRSVDPAPRNGAFGNEAVFLHVDLRHTVSLEAICDRLEALGLEDISLQRVGDRSLSELLIWVELQDSRTPSEISSAVVAALEGIVDLRHFERAGPNTMIVRDAILDKILD